MPAGRGRPSRVAACSGRFGCHDAPARLSELRGRAAEAQATGLRTPSTPPSTRRGGHGLRTRGTGAGTGRSSRSGCSPSSSSVVVHHWMYPAYSWNRDEPVYLWQVQRAARRADPAAPTAGASVLPAVAERSTDGLLLLAVHARLADRAPRRRGRLRQPTASAIAFGAAARGARHVRFRSGPHRGTTPSRSSPPRSWWCRRSSSVQSGMYLGYLFTLGLGLVFGAAFITGLTALAAWLLVVAGCALGWLFMTRPFDAVLWAAPSSSTPWSCTGASGKRLHPRACSGPGGRRCRCSSRRCRTTSTSPGASPQFPITAADPLDTFGFGLRRLMPTFGKADYTVGLRHPQHGQERVLPAAVPLRELSRGWSAAGVGLWFRRRQRSRRWRCCCSWPRSRSGYFFFWGMHVSVGASIVAVGADLLLPLYAPLVHPHRDRAARHGWRDRRAVASRAGVSPRGRDDSAVAANRLDVNHAISESQVPWRDGADAMHGRVARVHPAVGPVPAAPQPVLRRTPPISTGASCMPPTRAPRTSTSSPSTGAHALLRGEQPVARPVAHRPQPSGAHDHRHPRRRSPRGDTVTLHTTVTNTGDDPTVVAYLQVGRCPAGAHVEHQRDTR